MTRMLLVAALATAAAACDPQATAANGAPRLDDPQLSKAGESCASSLDCRSGLRCLEQTCVPQRASVLGDLYAATGEAALAGGDVEAAIDAYTRAVNQYLADDLEPPPALYCAQGHALVEDRADATRGELAARVLHKCLLGASAGSIVRKRALRDLTLLVEVGLDPLLLARSAPADAYLTKDPQLPAPTELTVAVEAKGRKPSSRTYESWIEMLRSKDAKRALAPCWQKHWKDSLDLSFRYTYRLDEYDDFERSILRVEGENDCVVAALGPLADSYSKSSPESTWRTAVRLTLSQ